MKNFKKARIFGRVGALLFFLLFLLLPSIIYIFSVICKHFWILVGLVFLFITFFITFFAIKTKKEVSQNLEETFIIKDTFKKGTLFILGGFFLSLLLISFLKYQEISGFLFIIVLSALAFLPLSPFLIFLIGLGFFLPAVKEISEEVRKKEIFKNYLKGIVLKGVGLLLIVGIFWIAFFFVASLFGAMGVTDEDIFGSTIWLLFFVFIGWIFNSLGNYFQRESFQEISQQIRKEDFRRAGNLLFIGSFLMISLIITTFFVSFFSNFFLIFFLITIFIGMIVEILGSATIITAFLSLPETLFQQSSEKNN